MDTIPEEENLEDDRELEFQHDLETPRGAYLNETLTTRLSQPRGSGPGSPTRARVGLAP